MMPPKKKRGCLWHPTGGGRSRESSIQSVSSRQNLSGLERARQEVACCGATAKVEQRGCNHRARKELTSSAAVVCHTLKITYSVSTTSKATYESTSCWDVLVPVPKENCLLFSFSFQRRTVFFLSRTCTNSSHPLLSCIPEQIFHRLVTQLLKPAFVTHPAPISQRLTFPVSRAVGAGVSNVQSPTLNPTDPTEGEQGCGRPALHGGVGSGAACGETKDVSKIQRNKQDKWELKVPPRSPLGWEGKVVPFL